MREIFTSFGRLAAHVLAALSDGADAITRPVRFVLAMLDEAITILCFGLFVLLALAQPAFRETGPNWLRRLDLAVTFVDSAGTEIGRRGIRHEDTPKLASLPRHLIAAVLATEDQRFYRHWGVDPIGLGRAITANAKADAVVQGGSTITQQLAKNVFLSGERTFERKINEAFLAIWLECQLTKDEILKLYLDRAYMGAGTLGIEAAAQFYFGKSAEHLTLAESAMLAGLFKAPSRYAPHVAPKAAQARASDVLDRMIETGAITRAEAEAAKREPAASTSRKPTEHPDHYLDWAYREVQRLAAAGRLGNESILTVETTLDLELQRRAESSIDTALERQGERLKVGEAAFVAMEPTGAMRALIGGHDYSESQFNRATDAQRQPGSAFKPIVYAAALAHTGLRPGSTVVDEEICIGKWCPANYSRSYSGAISLTTALTHSLNTVAVRLSVEIGRNAGQITLGRQAAQGRAKILALARDFGIRTPLHDTPSLPLGASEVTPLDLTAAYAVFANGGFRAEPYAVRIVRDRRGQILYDRERDVPAPARVLAPEIVGDMNHMLTKVVEAGTARRAAIARHVVAGKTGTTSAYRDAWFVGYSAQLVGGIWLGNDNFKPTRQVTGGTLPTAIWHDIMAVAHRKLSPVALPETEGGPRSSRGLIAEIGPARGGRGNFQEVSRSRGGFTVVR